jgi:hypothetical protein
MITIWTIMVITFGDGPFQGYETFLPFSSSSICGENIMPMREELEADGLKIEMIRCIKTNRPSASIRPRTRP